MHIIPCYNYYQVEDCDVLALSGRDRRTMMCKKQNKLIVDVGLKVTDSL